MTVLDLFAGPGGWDLGARALGLNPIGLELDDAACATRRAAGLRTMQCDVAAIGLKAGWLQTPVRGLIASPPCQAWSMAGKGGGRRDKEHVVRCAGELAANVDTRAEHAALCEDPRSILVVEPLRWALALQPEWLAFEQVPPVLELWSMFAQILALRGYSTWTGVLEAERYGIIATCPEHDPRPALVAGRPLSLTALAHADPAATQGWRASAPPALTAERASNYATSLGAVARAATGAVTGSTATAALADAWTVANLARAAMDAASDATWRERVRHLLSRALPARTTQRGRAAAAWTTAVTCESGWKAPTGESIAWSPSVFWVALCEEARSFITSMGTSPTTSPTTCGSSPATGTTRTTTTPERSRAACSLCDDVAVPQTRERAILIARRSGGVAPPRPTHQRYVKGEPQRHDVTLEGEILPWVSMAEALGWQRGTVTDVGNTRGGTRTEGRTRSVEEPAPAITSRSDQLEHRPTGLRAGTNANDIVRQLDEPAPTVRFGARGNAVDWVFERPATTVAGDARIWPPGHKKNADDERAGRDGYGDRAGTEAVRVTVEEAAALQSFPARHPWQGNQTQQRRQVGDAVPPLLAMHVLSAVTGIEIPTREEVADAA